MVVSATVNGPPSRSAVTFTPAGSVVPHRGRPGRGRPVADLAVRRCCPRRRPRRRWPARRWCRSRSARWCSGSASAARRRPACAGVGGRPVAELADRVAAPADDVSGRAWPRPGGAAAARLPRGDGGRRRTVVTAEGGHAQGCASSPARSGCGAGIGIRVVLSSRWRVVRSPRGRSRGRTRRPSPAPMAMGVNPTGRSHPRRGLRGRRSSVAELTAWS